MTSSNRWYPPQVGVLADQAVFDAHKQTLDMLYDAHDQIKVLKKQIEDMKPAPPPPPAGGPLNTSIGGFLVKPGQPKTGDTIRFGSDNQWGYGV